MAIDFSKFMKSDYSKYFIKDTFGNNIFYAGGLIKGRIVPDKEIYEKIVKALEREEKISLPCFIAIAFILCIFVFYISYSLAIPFVVLVIIISISLDYLSIL